MSPLMDAFEVTLEGGAAFRRGEEVGEKVREKLAKDVERELRIQADPGIEGARPDTLKVESTDTGLVIKSENPMAILEEVSRRANKQDKRVKANSVEDLFTQSSGVPEVTRDHNGVEIAAFRSIQARDLEEGKEQLKNLVQQSREFQRDQTIKRAVETNLPQSLDEAYKEVNDLHQGEK